MKSARLAAVLLAAGLLQLTAPAEAAPVPRGDSSVVPDELVSPVCHRGYHHFSGRPCGYGYGYRRGPPPGPPAYGYYGGPRYGYGHRRGCRWARDEWGRSVRVCGWR